MNRRKFISGTVLATAAGGFASAFANELPSGHANAQNIAAAPNTTGTPKFSKLHTIGLEEHYLAPPYLASPGGKAFLAAKNPLALATRGPLQDLGEGRLALMDAAGIDVQVLSHSPGLENLEASEQIPMVRDTNDFLKDAI